MAKYDIKCDKCGRFFPYCMAGSSQLFVPSSDVSNEECYYRCLTCTNKHGSPKAMQVGVVNSVVSIIFSPNN